MFRGIITNGFTRTALCTGISLWLIFLWAPSVAYAHSAERGLVLLLPTGYYTAGGAIAVLASFLLVSMARAEWLMALGNMRRAVFSLPAIENTWSSMIAFTVLLLLIIAGFIGSSDPLSNPLPLFIWTLWWIGFTLLQFLLGNLWNYLNPWSGPVRLFRRACPFKLPQYILPEKLGYLPAILFYFGFVAFELVDLAPEDPTRLAKVITIYWLLHFIGCLIFGEHEWRARAEPFSIFFRLIGCCSPLVRERYHDHATGRMRVRIFFAWPGSALVSLPTMPLSGIFFVLLTLSSVSFDGFAKTFVWLSWIGVNPLDFPGRSAVQTSNTLGIFLGFSALTILFLSAVRLGISILENYKSTHNTASWIAASGRLIYSIIPISIAFHLAHYLTVLLVNGQYAVISFTDPFDLGWAHSSHGLHVTTSFLSNIESVSLIWTFQTIVIAVGHILGIVIAHLISVDMYNVHKHNQWTAGKSQIFLAILMVAYTVFGLWLLSTASIG